MRRQAVESTTVRSIGYDARRKVLEIEFQSGTVYQYFDVLEAVHEGFWSAESKGRYFNRIYLPWSERQWDRPLQIGLDKKLCFGLP
jgi:hypothetical protein